MDTTLPTDSIAARFAAGSSTGASTSTPDTGSSETSPLTATGSMLPPQTGMAGYMSPDAEASSSIAARFANQSFTTPSGTTLTPGQTVTHSSGVTGTVTGQHPSTGHAIIDWIAPKDPTTGNRVDLSPIVGFGKGIAETGQGLQHIAGLDNTFWGTDPKIDTTPVDTGEKLGKFGETLAEFMSGDEALKALPVAERFLTSGKLVKALENSPRVMQALKIGMGAMRAGVLGGGQDYAKTGGDTAEALRTGVGAALGAGVLGTAGGAVGGDGGDSVASNVGDVVKAAKDDLEAIPSKAKSAFETAKNAASDLVHASTKGQDELQTAVKNIAEKTAIEAGPRGGVGATGNPTNPIEPAASTTIRDVFRNLANAIETRAQSAYQELDAATGGNVSRFDKELKNVENAIRNSTGIDESADAALEARKSSIIEKQEQAFKQAEENGVPREKVEQARADWRQKSALNDLDTHLKKSTPVSSNAAETRVDPNKFRTRITNLHDSGRLHEAVGADNADALRDAAVKAAEAQAKALARQKIAKAVGKTAAYGTGIGIVGDIVKHAIE